LVTFPFKVIIFFKLFLHVLRQEFGIMAILASIFIDIVSVPNLNHSDDQFVVFYPIQDSIIALSNSVFLLA